MNIKLLDNGMDIRETFINHFVMSWEEFHIKQKEWIVEMARNNFPINREWYEQSYMWDRMNPDFPRVSMEEALAFLKEHCGTVLFMSEKGEDTYYQGKKLSILLPKQKLVYWHREYNRNGMILTNLLKRICMMLMHFFHRICMFLICQ